MSHELRTPLNGIVGLSEAILHGASGEISLRCRKNVQAVKDCGERLTDVIKNMLQAVEDPSAAIPLSLEMVNLQSICDDVAELIRPLLKKGVVMTVDVPEDLTMEGDPEKMAEIVYKVCENAAKVVAAGSVSVTGRKLRKDQRNWIELSISDTGVGIPENKLLAIFEPFEQIDMSSTRELGGTGLGLHIVRKLVECFNGRVTADSTIGEGSCFTIIIPRRQPRNSPMHGTAAKEGNKQKNKMTCK